MSPKEGSLQQEQKFEEVQACELLVCTCYRHCSRHIRWFCAEFGEWGLRSVRNSSLMLLLRPHTLLHPACYPSNWIQSWITFSNVAQFHQKQSFGKTLLHGHSSCWKTLHRLCFRELALACALHGCSVLLGFSTECHVEMSSTVAFNTVCRGISVPACGAPPCPPPSLPWGSAVLLLTLGSHSPLMFCCAVVLHFSKNILYQRCHPTASISPHAHTTLRNEQILKTPNPKKNQVNWLGF